MNGNKFIYQLHYSQRNEQKNLITDNDDHDKFFSPLPDKLISFPSKNLIYSSILLFAKKKNESIKTNQYYFQ